MKKILKTLSVLMIITLFSSLTAFAAGSTDASLNITPAAKTVAPGETFTITLNLVGESDSFAAANHASGKFGVLQAAAKISFDPAALEYISAEAGSIDEISTADFLIGTDNLATGNITFTKASDTVKAYETGDFTIATVTFKAKDSASGNTEIAYVSGTSVTMSYTDTKASGRAKVTTGTGATITIAAGGNEPAEEFVVADKTVAGAKVAFFAKNVTGTTLPAGTYGINFGGVPFAAGVDANKAAIECKADETFVVAFEGELAAGTYTYYAYYNSGENKSNVETIAID